MCCKMFLKHEYWLCPECGHRNGLGLRYCELCNTQRW